MGKRTVTLGDVGRRAAAGVLFIWPARPICMCGLIMALLPANRPSAVGRPPRSGLSLFFLKMGNA